MPTEVFWRLVYPGGSEVSEPSFHVSIREARPGARFLQAIDAAGDPLCQIDLRGHRPVWYRRRSMSLDGRAEGRLDAVVFGRATDTDKTVDGNLWVWDGDRAIDCPDQLIDRAMISLQVIR